MTVPWKECASPENTQKVAKSCHCDSYSTDMSFNFPLHLYQGDKRHAGIIFEFICLRISTWLALPWCNQEGTISMRFQIDNCFPIRKQNITMIKVFRISCVTFQAKSGGAPSSIDPQEWLSKTSTSPSPQLFKVKLASCFKWAKQQSCNIFAQGRWLSCFQDEGFPIFFGIIREDGECSIYFAAQ